MMTRTASLILVSVGVALAQPTPPLFVHRTAAPPQSSQPLNTPTSQEMQSALGVLQAGDTDTLPQPPAPSAAAKYPDVPQLTKAPKGYKPLTDVELDHTTSKALALADSYLANPSVPAEGNDGRLRYVYGAGLATVVCAPLHLCTVELELGEVLNAKPTVSDELHWDVLEMAVGAGDATQTLITLRPHKSGLDDNLLITTDRRSYYLRIVSKPAQYMARVAFEYPSANSSNWVNYQVEVAARQAQKPAADKQQPTPTTWTGGYRLSGKKHFLSGQQHPAFWPTDVKDDGKFVYIDLPELITHTRAPILMRCGPKGLEPMNYDVAGSQFIAHSLFEKAALITGTGKHSQVVYITSPREGK